MPTANQTIHPGGAAMHCAQSMPDDAFPVPLVRLDCQGRVLSHNRHWARLMEAATPGTDLINHVHPEDGPAWRQALAHASGQAATGDEEALRLRFVHAQGGLHWLDVKLHHADGLVSMAVHDATRHQRRETALQAGTRSLHNLLNSLPALVYRGRNDRNWTMEVVSEGCLALTGYPAESLRNGHRVIYSSLILPADADYVWDTVQEALRLQAPYALCYRIRCADGRIKQVFEKGQGIYSDSGEVLGIEGAMFELDACIAQRLGMLPRAGDGRDAPAPPQSEAGTRQRAQ